MPNTVSSFSPLSPLTAPRAGAGPIVKPLAQAASNTNTAKTAQAAPQPVTLSSLWQSFSYDLKWLLLGPVSKEFKTRQEVREGSTTWANPSTVRAAVAHLSAAKGDEAAALAKLGPRAADYNKLARLCDTYPVARDTLLRMLLDGRLTGEKDLSGKADMLTYLAKMATQPLPDGMDRAELVKSVIQEMDDPVKIGQQEKGTCAATTSTVVLVRKAPAEYARLVQELASPAGTTRTIDGHKLDRAPDWADSSDGGRTPSLRMLQPPLMNLGDPTRGLTHYSNTRDAFVLDANTTFMSKFKKFCSDVSLSFQAFLNHFQLPGGLETAGTNRVLQALTGDKYSMIYAVTRLNRDSAWKRVEAEIAAGKSVPCGMYWEGGGHEILLDKIQDGWCYFNNPWGETDKMSVDEFKANLVGANLLK